MNLKTKEINKEIERVLDSVSRFYHWRAEQYLGCELSEPKFTPTPLELSLRSLFDHVTGITSLPEIREVCQAVCEALFVAPGNQGGEYTIPESFWQTLTGEAVRFALGGGDPTIADDDEIETGEVCAWLGVTRATLQNWRENGKLVPVGVNPINRGSLYRAADVRRLARERGR